MFVGHYTPSFALARSGPVPLWVLFLGGLGSAIWDHPALSFLLEAALLLLAVGVYARGARRALPFWSFALAMLAMQSSSFVLPLPETPTAFATMSMANYIGLAAVGAFLERRWG